ncbi:diguanylate cyclase [Vibrio diazotrophicus]|nr:sensor domain-containing diguanylate cyclase [Vibrio diazotrophicus]NIY92927.1 diguanylate cyclase [Vibrio diazotrophicus]
MQVKKFADDKHALECSHCGARGPKSNIDEQPALMVSMSGYNLFRTVIDESPDVICIKNWEGQFLLCNKALASLYGSTPEQMVGKTDADFNENVEQILSYIKSAREVLESGQTTTTIEMSTNAETGEIRYYQSVKKPILAPNGSKLLLIVAHDITELKNAYQAVEESEKRYNFAMEASNVGIWDWNIVNNKVHHNSKWCDMLGLKGNMRVHDMSILKRFIHPTDAKQMMMALGKALEEGVQYDSEHRMVRADGEVLWVHDRGRVVEFDQYGNPIRMVGSFSDITLSKRFERQLEKTSKELERNNETLEQIVQERTEALELAVKELENIATRDQLTGVGNRLMLEQWLTMQTRNQEFVSILIDLDRFKSINDRFGHHIGDEVLEAASQCLSDIRESDLLIRWGGEEFLVLLTNVTIEQACMVAENLRVSLQNADMLPINEQVTASFGICAKPFKKNEFDIAIKQSDEALYHAKNTGRNKVKVCGC